MSDKTSWEAEEKVEEKVKLSKRCLLAEAADAVLCQVFAFLNVREHWKLSRSSRKINRVSLMHQASPQLIDIDNNIDKIDCSESDQKYEEVHDRRVQRLLNFRPSRLTLPANFKSEWINTEKMTQLRELTFTKQIENDPESIVAFNHNLQWISELTRLTKLIIPDETFHSSFRLPDSLTHLNIFQENDADFRPFATSLLPRLLEALQVLKLPMTYHDVAILKVGAVFPALRELSLGFFDLRHRAPVNFTELQSCKNLEALTVGVDPEETDTHWETLASIPSLRRLTIVIYQTRNPTNSRGLLDGLAQVTQLTHLQLLVHGNRRGIEISADIHSLTTAPTIGADAATPSALSSSSVPSGVLPRLTTLLIGEELAMRYAHNLSSFGIVEELMLPDSIRDIPHFPRLHTLHVSKSRMLLLHHYKDQISTLYYKDLDGIVDEAARVLLCILSKMKKLTTLKLHPCCAIPRKHDTLIVSVAEFLKRGLPAIVQVEIDSSMPNY